MGNKEDGTWRSNPAPYNAEVNITNQRGKTLNLHYIDTGGKATV